MSVLKIAIHNPFFGQSFAEAELAARMLRAIQTLGHQGFDVFRLEDILSIQPDFILALHPNAPKISEFPTYGCMWNPPEYYTKNDEIKKNICSYDGFCYGSRFIEDWVSDLIFFKEKANGLGPLLPTANAIPFLPSPKLKSRDARIVYFGSNWDKQRHKELFQRLESSALIDVYGKPEGWDYLDCSYKGMVPFDGFSVMETLAAGGVGLCLHTPTHIAVPVPTMRIFEITMAGAVAIADRHPFIEQNFEDSVLYIDGTNPEEDDRAIRRHVHWIRNNPDSAVAMARRAHEVCERYSLEKLLNGVIEGHTVRLSQRYNPVREAKNFRGDGRLQVIVRTGGRNLKYLKRTIDSLTTQNYSKTEAIIVVYDNHEQVANFLSQQVNLKHSILYSSKTGYRSTQLFDGLRSISSEFFAILDDDDIIYPSHYSELIALLSAGTKFDLAYSGSNEIIEYDRSPGKDARVSVAHYQEFNRTRLQKFDNYITSNAFVARSAALRCVPLGDPRLEVAEDFYLLLKLQKYSDFVFSGNVTCGFHWRGDSKDNSTFLDSSTWVKASERVRMLTAHDFEDQVFKEHHAPCAECTPLARPLRTLGRTKLRALFRHPFNSKKRKAYRHKRKVRCEK